MSDSSTGPARICTGLSRDLRFAVRGLRRSPVLASFVVLTLAAGLGGATAIFGVVETVVLFLRMEIREQP